MLHCNRIQRLVIYNTNALHPESTHMTELVRKRPEFRNINALKDLPSYRLPAAGIVSILHRISGFLMFLLMPLFIWLFDNSITSEIS